MFVIVSMSVVSVAACLVTLSRVIGWHRILKHSTWIDVSFTLGLGWFLAGTMTGALVAVLGGLVMALVLTAIKWLVGAAGSVSARPRAVQLPAGVDPTEYDAEGRWVYNTAPYLT